MRTIVSENVGRLMRAENEAVATLIRRLGPMAHADIESRFKAGAIDAADALLIELAETSFSSFLTDPLAPFDSEVGILATSRIEVYCEPKNRSIAITLGAIEAFEFIAAHAALRRMADRISEHLEQRFGADSKEAAQMRESKKALYSMLQVALVMFFFEEADLPVIAPKMPRYYKEFVRQQTSLSIVFGFLHEQAHIEFAWAHATPEGPSSQIITETLGEVKAEEYAADRWAIERLKPEMRTPLLNAAISFLYTYWTIDYAVHGEDTKHPLYLNRIHALLELAPAVWDGKERVVDILSRELPLLTEAKLAFETKDQRKRFAAIMRYCRARNKVTVLEELTEYCSSWFESNAKPENEPQLPGELS
jgi:hypothetical protein